MKNPKELIEARRDRFVINYLREWIKSEYTDRSISDDECDAMRVGLNEGYDAQTPLLLKAIEALRTIEICGTVEADRIYSRQTLTEIEKELRGDSILEHKNYIQGNDPGDEDVCKD